MSKPSVALQLYTVRDFTSQDMPDTLRKVKAAGYDAVELAGTYGLETAEFKKLLDEIGLKAVSAHVPIQAFEDDAAGTVAQYKALGCEIISVPWLDQASLPGGEHYDKTKALLNKAAELCKEQGVLLAYHNHEFEFKPMPCGTFVLDALFNDLSVLQAQLDTGWVTAAGQDPVAYVKKYAGRCPSVHLKDITKVDGKYEDRPVGKGVQDMPAITKAAVEAGVKHMVVELDEAVGMTSMEAAAQSREYLKSIGY